MTAKKAPSPFRMSRHMAPKDAEVAPKKYHLPLKYINVCASNSAKLRSSSQPMEALYRPLFKWALLSFKTQLLSEPVIKYQCPRLEMKTKSVRVPEAQDRATSDDFLVKIRRQLVICKAKPTRD